MQPVGRCREIPKWGKEAMRRITVPTTVAMLMLGLVLAATAAERTKGAASPRDADNPSARSGGASNPLVEQPAGKSKKSTDGADSSSVPGADEIQLTYADKMKLVTATVGKTLFLRLPGSDSTGFQWEITQLTGDAIKSVGEPEYKRAKKSPEGVGMPGVYIFKFEAAKLGKSSLKLVYHRPSDKKKAPANTFAVKILVRSN